MGDWNLSAVGHVEPLRRIHGVDLEQRRHYHLHDMSAQEIRGLEIMSPTGSRLENET